MNDNRTEDDDVTSSNERNFIFFLGVLGLLFVPIFKLITDLPPYMGMLLSLGVIWIVTEILHRNKIYETRKKLTVIGAIKKIDIPTRVQSAISMSQIAEPYIKRKAVRHLEKKRIVIFAAGTGNPFFSTDTAASLRASEMGCVKIIKATKVDGIYDSDPKINKNAKLIRQISYSDVINRDLRVMDLTAISLAKESNIPIYITNIFNENSLTRTLKEEGNYSKIN